MSRSTKLIAVVILLIVSLSLIPFTTTIVPEWKLTVVDVNGKPCGQNRVTQQWSHDSLGYPEYGGKDDRLTDAEGSVVFPERTVRASLAYRVVVTAVRALGALVHAGGYGIHGSVYATGFISPDGVWALIYKPGLQPPNRLLVEECMLSSEV